MDSQREERVLSFIVTLKKRTVQKRIHSTVQRTVQHLDKDVSPSSEVTTDGTNLPHSKDGRAKVEVLDGPASKIIIMINI